ncbi:MAG TPA: SRPBCC family protein [Planctomycetota bacterium]|nr:SRPBCC family protein [Planctomycetota bacterium]
MKPDPKLDLTLERTIDVPPRLLWKAWTEPRHLLKWYCPLPWKVVECDIDLRPGGLFRTLMRGPGKGEEQVITGCYLELVENRKLVWTDSLVADFRPNAEPFLTFTAVIEMQAKGKGTKYSALVMHKDPETRKKHDEMGFRDGWGKATDQLAEFAKTL